MSKWGRRKRKEPEGYDYVEPTLTALEDELRDRMSDSVEGVKKAEVLWPVHQINWQKSRYIYDMFHTYKKISKEVYRFCIDNKIVDGPLMDKWSRAGYEKLCSTFVINTKNYPYGTVSICRVPRSNFKEDTHFRDNTTGCRGCASGAGGYDNIFGNKYGQRLAKIQVLREKMLLDQQAKAEEASAKAGAEADKDTADGAKDKDEAGKLWAKASDVKQYKLDQDEEPETKKANVAEVEGDGEAAKGEAAKGVAASAPAVSASSKKRKAKAEDDAADKEARAALDAFQKRKKSDRF